MKNILQLLERSEKQYPNKIALIDSESEITYKELLELSKRVGSVLSKQAFTNKPIVVYMDKGVDAIISMMGVVYSGNPYTVIDTEMPVDRVKKILNNLQPAAVITDEKYESKANKFSDRVFLIEGIKGGAIDEELLENIRKKHIDTYPLYVLYTSGSTGIPKGTVINHRNVLAYSEWVVKEFDINNESILANQTPFYFSMSVTDIYSTLRAGSTMVIIPKEQFMFPVNVVEKLNKYKVNTIYWVPSVFGIIANTKTFDNCKPKYLKKVLFAGEVMPMKHLNYWINSLGDDVLYANLFGPTETTDICSYYIVDRKFKDSDTLPIGNACDNCNVFIVDENGKEVKGNKEGELYIQGSFVSPGYYNDPEKTKESFVQNPLNNSYIEYCYKTGDLVKRNSRNELVFICRKDFQIKKNGYRIELGEIEACCNGVKGVNECACVYDSDNQKIVLFFSSSSIGEKGLRTIIDGKLNSYFMPDYIFEEKSLPKNQNGKINRKQLEERINHGDYY